MALPQDKSPSGLTCIANFSGRVWYSGAGTEIVDGDDKSPNIGTFVFFTQIIDSKDKYDKCYQEADPTSEDISDLIDSDGGFVSIAGANRIFKLVPLQNSLVVFAENGVWQILGGEGGFSATAYQVTKIHEIAADSKQSIVEADNVVFYWAKSGIYVLTPSDVTPVLRPQNLTEQSIQTFYTSIPPAGRRNAVGSFDGFSREVRWLYNDESTYDGENYRYKFNRELVFNTALNAFHTNTLSNNINGGANEGVAAYYISDNEITQRLEQLVTVNGEQVQVSLEDVVVTANVSARRSETATKYLAIREGTTNVEFTFATYNDTSFSDWGTVDAKGQLITGYESFGDTQRGKKLDSLTMHCLRTETGYTLDGNSELQYDNPSSLQITFKYDWTENDDDTQDHGPVQGYKLRRQYIPEDVNDSFSYPYRVVSTQLAPKGGGTVMSMKIETEVGKDAYILGWGFNGSGDGRS